MNGNKLLHLIGTVVIIFALKFIEHHSINIAKNMRILLDRISGVKRHGIPARFIIDKKFMKHSTCTLLTFHLRTLKEQPPDILIELVRAFIQFVLVPVQQHELRPAVIVPIDSQTSEICGLS